jgi:hypothetical protein
MLVDIQEKDNWCWAAVARSVSRFVKPGLEPSQCLIANRVLAARTQPPLGTWGPCCANPPQSSHCNLAATLADALNGVNVAFQFLGDSMTDALTFEDVRREIDNECPICVHIQWKGGGQGGHFVLITGYRQDAGGNRFVTVMDPSRNASLWGYARALLDFEKFRYQYQGKGKWDQTYYVRP